MTRYNNISERQANLIFLYKICPTCEDDRNLGHENEVNDYYLVECTSCGDEFMFDMEYIKENFPEKVEGEYELVYVECEGKIYPAYVLKEENDEFTMQ